MTMYELAPVPEPRVPSKARVVVAVDGGPGSRAALRWAAGYANDVASQVLIVTVAPEGVPVEDAESELRAAALVLRTIVEDAEVSVHLRRGSPVDQLSHAASEFDADILVVGTHASTARPQAGRVTVAGRLAARAQCIVVVVPSHWTPSRGPIVVGSSIDSASERAVEFAYDLSRQSSRPLVVTHAWKLPTVGEVAITPGGTESIPERQATALAALVGHLAARGHTVVRADLQKGDAHAALVAASEGASLVVVGRRTRPALAASVLGSTSRALVAAPPCPIAVVPAPRGGLHISPDIDAEDV